MATGEVGIHRTRYGDDPIPLNEVKAEVRNNHQDIDRYLTEMGAPPQYIWYFKSIPNWDMNYLANYEKRDYGLFSATAEEMQYRLEIASQKLGRHQSDLLNSLTDRKYELYPEATWASSDYKYAVPSCSEQLFLEDNMTDHVGINIEPDSQDIFEIYHWDRGIINDDEKMISTDKVPHKDDQSYYYNFKYYAKGEDITYQERLTVAGPTTWGSSEDGINYADNKIPGYEVSDDKTSITVTKTFPNNGYVFSSWSLTKEDPKGPLKIEILFKNKVIQTFDYIIE